MKNKLSNLDIEFEGDNVEILRQLGRLCKPYNLYMVGGCVRDKFLGIEMGDIDIASNLPLIDLQSKIAKTDFKVVGIIENTGTAIIKYKNRKYEYTRFRKDLYRKGSGEHKPQEVAFVDDIKIDAERRDFKVNAIYRNVLSGEIVDPLGGVKQIEERLLSTTRNPENVFEEDGLRLMRLARFAGQLEFKVEKETLEKAKENVWRIRDIARERIFDELSRILNLGNLKRVKAFEMIFQIGLNRYILDETFKTSEIHYLEYDDLDEVSKWSILSRRMESGEIKKYFDNMRAPKKLAEQVSKLCAIQDKDVRNKVELMKYLIDNQEVIKSLVIFHKAMHNFEKAKKIENSLKEMITNKVPMNIQELPINGQDLIELGVPNIMRSKVLKELQMAILSDLRLRDRDLALEYVKNKQKMEKMDI